MINKKSEKGITLITLVATVVLLIIISSILAVNSTTSLQLSNLTKLQNDIEALDTRVAAFYLKNKELPIYEKDNVSFKYSKSNLINKLNDMSVNDGENYYTLNLELLDVSLNSLNYGLEYTTWDSADRYIINEKTHVIYYLKGIICDGEEYHTIGANPDINS